ncbi:MAG: hypothetical protein R2856_07255 [Caldilineaceae bacterium]
MFLGEGKFEQTHGHGLVEEVRAAPVRQHGDAEIGIRDEKCSDVKPKVLPPWLMVCRLCIHR